MISWVFDVTLSQGSGKELIQPVLDNQLKAASPLVLPPQVCENATAGN